MERNSHVKCEWHLWLKNISQFLVLKSSQPEQKTGTAQPVLQPDLQFGKYSPCVGSKR